MNRQKWTLAILLLFLLLSVGYSVLRWPRQERVVTRMGAPVKENSKSILTAPAADVVRLRSDLLEQREIPPRRPARNLFGSSPPAVERPPVAQPVVALPPPPPPPPPPVIQPTVEVQAVSEETQIQLGRFVFLGYLEKDRIKTIFLSSAGEIFVVKKGDRFGEKKQFEVVDLSATQLKVRQGSAAQVIVIPLLEQAALAPQGASGRGTTAPATKFIPAWRTFPPPQATPTVEAAPDVPEVPEAPSQQNTLSTEGVVHEVEN